MIENKNLVFKVSTSIIKFALKIVYFGSFNLHYLNLVVTRLSRSAGSITCLKFERVPLNRC